MLTCLLLLLAYVIGSTPFGLIVALLVGRIDIRKHGSGNIGATNVGRVLGSKWGIIVLVLDLLKGVLTVWLLPPAIVTPVEAQTWVVATGVMTIVGHMFPFWLRFSGGKGVATALGVVVYLAPWAMLAAAGMFIVSVLLWRIVSLSSILAVLAFAVVQVTLQFPDPFGPTKWPLTTFSLLVPALIILRHRTNVIRLFRGEEPRYELGKKVRNRDGDLDGPAVTPQ